ncbi:MAG: tRNA lysidine(34) synthetase TilS [Litoreibacter sp.]|nr:tRNA lysidine(34) synthetase TilS [Litoreibacter sp.]
MTAAKALLHHLDLAFGAKPPRQLAIAISGGGDSTALLHLAVQWGKSELLAVTVDHGLRPEASGEAEQVAGHCAEFGVPHEILRWSDWDGQGNLQDAARRARYRLICDWAGSAGVSDVAFGHTADDNAETFIMGLSRGAGLDGLSGMRPRFSREGLNYHRPLLAVSRDDLRLYLQDLGVAWIEDPSNLDLRFDRIKARKALATLSEAGVTSEALNASIGNLNATRRDLNRELMMLVRDDLRFDRGDLLIGIDRFLSLSPEYARRLLNACLRLVSGQDYPPRAEKVMRLIDEAGRGGGTTLHGCQITTRVSDPVRAIRIAREPAAVAGLIAPTTSVWDHRWKIDGPHSEDLEVRALGGEGLKSCPEWRAAGLPRASLAASPAIWKGPRLVAAPLAGLTNGWTATLLHGKNSLNHI